MSQADVLQRVQAIFRDELDNEAIVLTKESSADDVEEWDSLSHIQLVVAVEKFFKIKFSSQEIVSWKNVGEMCNSIAKKLA